MSTAPSTPKQEQQEPVEEKTPGSEEPEEPQVGENKGKVRGNSFKNYIFALKLCDAVESRIQNYKFYSKNK